MRIAGVQTRIGCDVSESLKIAGDFIKKVQGDIICLPELFSTGVLKEDAVNFTENLSDDDSEVSNFLKNKAIEKGSYLIGGLIEYNENSPGAPYNSAVVFSPLGDLVGNYRKIKLFTYDDEHRFYSPGKRAFHFSVPGEFLKRKQADCGISFDTEDIRVGVMICYDLRFPEIARSLVKEGVEIIFVPANWPAVRAGHWKCLLKARAIENMCYFAGVNCTGKKDDGLELAGNSMIVGPIGEIVSEADDKEGLIEGEIDIKKLRELREDFNFFRDI